MERSLDLLQSYLDIVVLTIMEKVAWKAFECKYPECSNIYYRHVPDNFENKIFHKFPRNACSQLLWKQACKIDVSTDVSG